MDRRTRAQLLLDGLVGACKTALATGVLPATAGLRPQVMVTIDYHDLLHRLETGAAQGARYAVPRTGSGTFSHAGPVTPATIRKIACDADIIPVLLGSNGRILDVGRTTRIFPSHIRKALTARDRGCAFPNCTIPATWCEAHHITYWSHGGSTSTDNGVLLCTHHHHLVHKEQWKIQVTRGIPWFIPPPYIDPKQKPRQNHHHRT
ncbi:HNH endonuclease signature motif containing protein [Arthrobacter sp. MMS24-S77]